MTRSSVLLPLPDGPSRATHLAAGDGQVDAVEDGVPANATETSRTSSVKAGMASSIVGHR